MQKILVLFLAMDRVVPVMATIHAIGFDQCGARSGQDEEKSHGFQLSGRNPLQGLPKGSAMSKRQKERKGGRYTPPKRTKLTTAAIGVTALVATGGQLIGLAQSPPAGASQSSYGQSSYGQSTYGVSGPEGAWGGNGSPQGGGQGPLRTPRLVWSHWSHWSDGCYRSHGGHRPTGPDRATRS